MALNGTAWAAKASAFAAFVEGSSALALAPVAGGASVPFSLDQETSGWDETEGEPVRTVRLAVMTRTALTAFALYDYDGHRWTCETATKYAAGGVAWPHYSTLVRHVE